MKISHKSTKVLLIGAGLNRLDQMLEALNLVGADLAFADHAREGLRLMNLDPPDFIICSAELPDQDAARLCSAIRSIEKLHQTPILFAGETTSGITSVFRALDAGADDFITQHFDADAFLAKVVWMMEQRSDEKARRERYESLRKSQIQTLEIVRETAAMFRSLEADIYSTDEGCSLINERIEMGLSMIAGLANVLEEQIEAADSWFGKNEERKENFASPQASKTSRAVTKSLELSLAA